MEHPKGRRLILFPFPFQGHINPMLELASILHSKGFSITIVHTNFNSLKLNPSNHPHFSFHSISEDLSESEAAEKDILLLISYLNKKCGEPFRQCLSNLLSSVVTEEHVACLICDPLFDFTQSVSESLKLPRIMMRTGGASSTAVYAAYPLLQEKGYIPLQESRLDETVPELSPVKVKDLPIIHSSVADGFYKTARALTYDIKFSDGYIFNTFEDLEHDALTKIHKELQVPIFAIGPFHKYFPSSSLLSQDHSSSCISWLDTQLPKSVIYVSFGSLAAVNEAQFLDIAWGLANSKQPFLWVVRNGLVQGSEWLEPLPSGFLESLNGRGHIVKWAPQKEVLAHQAVGAFWTHNGWNSTLESICEGVPMICTPLFADQMVNARYASDVWKVGMQLEVSSIKREEIERGIRRLMLEKEGEEIRDRVSKLKEMSNLCLQQGGSSYRSIDRLVNHILSLEKCY